MTQMKKTPMTVTTGNAPHSLSQVCKGAHEQKKDEIKYYDIHVAAR